MPTLLRPLVAAALLALTSVLATLVTAAPAHAVDYYRYWSYFHVEGGAYAASDEGIGAAEPADGSVEAFRYAASAETSPNLPRVDPAVATFDAVCGDEAAESGEKRVAVIIDFGVDADSAGQSVPDPEAECADVPAGATAAQVLLDVAKTRTQSSSFGPLLCAIDGYPAKGCADQTTTTPTPADDGFVTVALDSSSASASDSASAAPSDLPQGPAQDNDQDTEQGRGANPVLYFGLGVVLFVIIGGGVFLARRRRAE